MTFEEKNERLKQIISQLQDKETTLTQAQMLYKEGLKLSKEGLKDLKTARGKIIDVQEIIKEIEE